MIDDSDLTRLFAQSNAPADDDGFVAGVTRRIVWRKRMTLAIPASSAAFLLLAASAVWPAAASFGGAALSGLFLIVTGIGAFFTSPTGMLAATVLLSTAALWAWLFERMRGMQA